MLYYFTKFSGLFGFDYKMAFAKFQGNRIRIDGEIAENHVLLAEHFVSLGIGHSLTLNSLNSRIQLPVAHVFRRFLNQFRTDFLEIMHKLFLSHVLT